MTKKKKEVTPTMNYRDIRVGDKVCVKMGLHKDKLSAPFVVTGIFTSLHDLNDVTLYLDFEGNEADVWEEDLCDVVKVE